MLSIMVKLNILLFSMLLQFQSFVAGEANDGINMKYGFENLVTLKKLEDKNLGESKFLLILQSLKDIYSDDNIKQKEGLLYLEQLSKKQRDLSNLIGDIYFSRNSPLYEPSCAYNWYSKSPDTPRIKLIIGTMLITGVDVPSDVDAGLNYVRQAMLDGSLDAKFLLSSIYLSEEFKDQKLAHKYLSELSSVNYDKAQYLLSQHYLLGLGVQKDEIASYNLLVKAANNGHLESIEQLATYYYNGVGTDVNQDKASTLAEKACSRGSESACGMLGFSLLNAAKTEEDLQIAIDYLLISDIENNRKSMKNLILAYNKLFKLTKNKEFQTETKKWFQHYKLLFPE
ncbi:MAG: sel1 repeat family protein [Enterobacterales bacterium]|nr:sel1 repeat family protein [Enterobacterales bacterium]